MTQPLPTTQEKPDQKPRRAAAPPGLPDERFWVRYSPHHELPLSGLGSLAIHGLVLALAVVLAALGFALWKEDKSLPVEAVALAGGGGGQPDGDGSDASDRNPTPRENVEATKPRDPQKPAATPDPLKPVEPAPLQFPE